MLIMEDTFYTIDFGVNYANSKKISEEKLKKILDISYKSGVDKIVCISNNIQESKNNLILADKYENLHFTLGIHPHNASQFKHEDMKFLEDNIKHKKCFGIGECGLDFNRNFSPKEKQIEVFKKQLELAKKTNSKLYLHCRDAYSCFIEILHLCTFKTPIF